MNCEEILVYTTIAASSIVLSCYANKTNRKIQRRKRRSLWSRPWLTRRQEGRDILNMLNTELLPEDPIAYQNFLRLTGAQFVGKRTVWLC